MTEVSVEIVDVATRQQPPETRLAYRVRNHADAQIWLVDDGWPIWRRDGSQTELSFARGRLQPGAQPFGYFPPTVARIEPGEEVTREVTLRWPLTLDRLWNEASEAAPPPGGYDVVVRVGYGVRPEPESPVLGQAVEDPVLHWQREAVSSPAKLHVPPYPDADGDHA